MKEVLIRLGLKSNVYMRDSNLTTSNGIVNLQSQKGQHCVFYMYQYYCDFYGIHLQKF